MATEPRIRVKPGDTVWVPVVIADLTGDRLFHGHAVHRLAQAIPDHPALRELAFWLAAGGDAERVRAAMAAEVG